MSASILPAAITAPSASWFPTRRWACALVALMIGVAPQALASNPVPGESIVIDSPAPHFQQKPVVTTAAGELVVVYESFDGDGVGLFGTNLDDPEFLIHFNMNGQQRNPAAEFNPDGSEFIVAYEDDGDTYESRLDPSGNRLTGGPFGWLEAHIGPAAIAFWEYNDTHHVSLGLGSAIQRFTFFAGARPPGVTVVQANVPGNIFDERGDPAAAGGNARDLLVWSEKRFVLGEHTRITASMWTNIQNVVDNEPVSSLVGTHVKPDVATDSSGKFLIVWIAEEAGEIQGRLYNHNFVPITDEYTIVDAPGAQGLKLAFAGDDSAVLAWWSDGGVFLQCLAPGGAPAGSVIPVTTSPTASHSDLAFVDDTTFVVVWDDFDGQDRNVYGQYYESATTGVADPQLIVDGRSILRAHPSVFGTGTSIDVRGFGASPTVRVFDINGRLVRSLPAGVNGRVDWDARNDGGLDVGSGVFFLRADGPQGSRVTKVTRVR